MTIFLSANIAPPAPPSRVIVIVVAIMDFASAKIRERMI